MLWFYSKLTSLLNNWISHRQWPKKVITHYVRLSEITTSTSLRLKLKSKEKGEMKMIHLQLHLLTVMIMDVPQVAPTVKRAFRGVNKLRSIVRTKMVMIIQNC